MIKKNKQQRHFYYIAYVANLTQCYYGKKKKKIKTTVELQNV